MGRFILVVDEGTIECNKNDPDRMDCVPESTSTSPHEKITIGSAEMLSRLMDRAPLLFNHDASSTSTMGALANFTSYEALSIPALCALSIVIAVALLIRKLRRQHSQPCYLFAPLAGLPPCAVPPHPIFGHLPHVFSPPDSEMFTSIFVENANSSGISTFKFLNVPCVSVLTAEHARFRLVFRSSIARYGNKVISRHFKRTLGQSKFLGS